MKKTINLNPYLVVGMLVMVILLWVQGCYNKRGDNKADKQLIEALNDSLRHYKDKDSNNVAVISVIQTARTKDFISLKIKDKEIAELQALVKDNKKQLKAGSVALTAAITTIAELKGRKPEIVYQKGDTVIKDGIKYLYPTYLDTLKNKWITLAARMSKDSSDFQLKVVNDFTAIVGYEKKKPFVELTTKNPYSITEKLRVYQVSIPKPKRFGIGFSTGVTLNSDLKPAPYVGIGLNYTIIRL